MTEAQLHRACAEWAAWKANELPELALLHHSPNGGKRPYGEAGKLKGMGTKPGFPDLFLPVARGNWHGWFAELKAPRGRTTRAQKWWMENLKTQGYFGGVIYTVEEFIWRISDYLGDTGKPQ